MAKILVVDDQPELAELVQTVLGEDGHAVEAVHGGQAPLDRLAQREYDLVICDLQMPDIDGAAIYRAIAQLVSPQPAVLLMTGYADAVGYEDFVRTVDAPTLPKPFDIEAITTTTTAPQKGSWSTPPAGQQSRRDPRMLIFAEWRCRAAWPAC